MLAGIYVNRIDLRIPSLFAIDCLPEYRPHFVVLYWQKWSIITDKCIAVCLVPVALVMFSI